MPHVTIEQVLARAEQAKSDSDFTYFFSLLLAAEAMAKTIVLGLVAAINDEHDRNRYRVEYSLVRADGIGEWGNALEDVVVGPASQFLSSDASVEQSELTRLSKADDWQYRAVVSLKAALDHLAIDSEAVPTKSNLKRWFRLFATLRNKTRAHGAIRPAQATGAAGHLAESIDALYSNFALFKRPWAFLYRNLSGKYRISTICGRDEEFEHLRKDRRHTWPNGVYVAIGGLRRVPLLESEPELQDFLFANGGFNGNRFELLSYSTGNKADGNATDFAKPAGALPPSETEGHGELRVAGHCFTNAPESLRDYVQRSRLESELLDVVLDHKRLIVTLVGRGGIGKTSLALKVVETVCEHQRYEAIVWLSARDVDLRPGGPKVVRPRVFSADDVAKLYADLVLSDGERLKKGFKPKEFFERQLTESEIGPCLFVLDNFETTNSPLELFAWIDTFVCLPNKVLITTRLRDFRGDYPIEVGGMDDGEALMLVRRTAESLGIEPLMSDDYRRELIEESEGHPYVIKVLLGEVAAARRLGNVRRLVASSDDILSALFERTYAFLTPCGQRAFLTLSAWASAVPRLALEAVLVHSTGERREVEEGIDLLLKFSMAELRVAPLDGQEFIGLPLVAAVFGKKKLNISADRVPIEADVSILQMLGPSRRDDVHLGLARRLERFIGRIASEVENGAAYEHYAPIVEMICRAYRPGWLLLARWHMEMRSAFGYQRAIQELKRFLEDDPQGPEAAQAWRILAHACYQTGDVVGEVHAFVELAQFDTVDIHDVSSTANRFNGLFRSAALGSDRERKRQLAARLLEALERRRDEAEADDLSRMAWLAIHLGNDAKAREFTADGLRMDQTNDHCNRLAERLGIRV